MIKEFLFSSIQGIILLNGAPIENANVIQIIEESNGKTQVYETQTNSNGQFSFESRTKNSTPSLFSSEYIVAQRINVKYKNKEYMIWSNTKRDKKENSEIGKPINFICELTDELSLYREFGSILRTNCKLN